MKIEDKIIKDEKFAIINYKGNVEDMGILIGKLLAWAEVNKVQLAGAPFAIYYTSPQNTAPEEMIYDMGIPVSEDTEISEEGEIKVVELLEHRVLSVMHNGSYKNLPDTYKEMVEYSIKNNYDIIGSPKEIYYNSPHEVPEEELQTEVQFPVIKM
ncbi:GyrI-like domain-containing protein [Methanobrevibacter sp. TMH8]|uniref:GyrI-like domain-containing protein n=1 Tax=Methanobrevibacter sp. TMH8 TaxID=2848611 RepID=UPI001CCCDD45|nr:GyrI-like domain-containing protein [Methanobrevibacter sp. TMH8]MBZ9571191.1 GyrI-like domain-containing protein [Methanobrevibacter sp. TMH8]